MLRSPFPIRWSRRHENARDKTSFFQESLRVGEGGGRRGEGGYKDQPGLTQTKPN